jgi:hypothetical protein
MSQQQKVVDRYSAKLAERIPDVEAILGEAPDYLELNSLYIERFGISLFQYNVNLVPILGQLIPILRRMKSKQHARTMTVTPLNTRQGSFVAAITCWDGVHQIQGWPREQPSHVMSATPLIFPKQELKPK